MQAEGGAALTANEQAGDERSEDRPAAERSGEPAERRRAPLVLLAVVALSVLALDAVTKAVAVAKLSGGEEIPLAGGLLTLTLVHNSGAAFGIGAGYTVVLSVLALGVVAFVLVMARRLRSRGWAVAFGLLLGGAAGNLADRFFREPGFLRGHVVDFLELPKWPVFNLADTAISCAAALIVWFALRGLHLDGTRSVGPSRSGGDEDESTEPAGDRVQGGT